MKVLYIADDGKEFDDEFECEHYEWILNHPNLKDVKIYDKRTGELFDDIMSNDDAYQITETGTWLFNEDEGVYEKVGD